VKEIIRQKIEEAVRELPARVATQSVADGSEDEMPAFDVPRVKDEQFGDYSTNIAMILGKPLGKSPMEIAEAIKQKILVSCHPELVEGSTLDKADSSTRRLARNDNTYCPFEKIEVARPGYINFFLSSRYFEGVLDEVLGKGEHFGDSEIGKGLKIDNEVISANPTGPLHLGNARGGFYGDALSRILRKAGYEVTNEYYINDAGEQVEKLGHSVLKDGEAVYAGDYIDQIIADCRLQIADLPVREVGEKAADYVLEKMIKPTVTERMGIPVDLWISEKRDIVDAWLVDRAIETLKEKGLTFESEEALWLRTTDFGDDKDRVLVKSDGSRTYFASDCGYILHKKDRGFSRLILILGADHHGYRTRLQAAAKALGFEGTYDISFVQLVRLMKDGKEVRMSKRAGNVVTIDELLEKIPVDVARFFFLMYSPDTHMNFDLGLAEERSAKNPVYYVQYAHARLASILRKAKEAWLDSRFHGNDKGKDGKPDFSLLSHPKERAILRELAFFPELVEEAAAERAPHRLPQYAMRLADKLHSFYDECKVIDPGHVELSEARLALIFATKIVLKETLGLMGVTAPERMESKEDK
jgi:arginyl-tRNA synthetase